MRLITFTIVNLVMRYPQQRRRPYLTYLHSVYLTATVYPQIITHTFRGKKYHIPSKAWMKSYVFGLNT